jgi:ABC-2 type transport system permease protein
MSAIKHATRTGAARGWIEFKLSLMSPQDQGFYLFMAVAVFLYLFFNRNSEVEGTTLLYPTVALPGIVGALVAFGLIIGPGYALAMEREDGTLLRAKAVPHGMVGYVTGQAVLHSLGAIPMLVVILVPGMFVFEGMMQGGTAGWLTFAWVLGLGMLATLPIGIVLGSVVPGVQKMGTWGMLPMMVMAAISGIFFPVQALWGWVQPIAQVFPVYWLGLGMRSAFLPEAASVLEIGESWRTLQTVLVLTAWAVLGLTLAPRVLRRMARRMSGSQVEAAREQAAQWVR